MKTETRNLNIEIQNNSQILKNQITETTLAL